MKMYVFLLASLVAVTLPRFNRNDWGVIQSLSGKDEHSYTTAGGLVYNDLPRDVVQYMKYVEYFRGNKQDPPDAPFSYRPLVPFAASLLPFDPMTSINVINLLLLGIGLIFFRIALLNFGCSSRESMLGCFIVIVSFPTFYYTTVGFVDGSLMGILLAGAALVSKNKPIELIGLTFIGLFVKETAIILLPVALMLAFQQQTLRPAGTKPEKPVALLIITILLSLFVSSCYILIRKFAPGNSQYYWLPSFVVLRSNLMNVRTYVTFLLTIGIPATLAYLGVQKLIRSGESLSRFLPLAVGTAMSVLLFIYSVFSVHSDGRFLWTSYPFLIPIGLSYFHNRNISVVKQS